MLSISPRVSVRVSPRFCPKVRVRGYEIPLFKSAEIVPLIISAVVDTCFA